MSERRSLQKKHLRSDSVGESWFKFNLFASFVSGFRYLEHGQNRYNGRPDRSVGSETTRTHAPYKGGRSWGSEERNVDTPPKTKSEAVSGLVFSELPVYKESFGFEDVGLWVSIFIVINCPSKMLYQDPGNTMGCVPVLTKCLQPRWILTCTVEGKSTCTTAIPFESSPFGIKISS